MKKALALLLTIALIFTAIIPTSFADSPAVSYTVSVNNQTGVVIISGTIAAGEGRQVTVLVLNPSGSVDYIDQTISGENGSFSFSYIIDDQTGGTYTVKIGGEVIEFPVAKHFVYDPSGGQETSEFIVVAEPAAVVKDQQVIVKIRAEKAVDLYAYNFTLTYDPAAFELESAELCDPAGSFILLSDTSDAAGTGTIRILATQTGDIPGITGSNVDLFRFVFKAKAEMGQSVFTLLGTGTFSDSNAQMSVLGQDISESVSIVSESPTPWPSETPTTSPSPSPTLSPAPSEEPTPVPSPETSPTPVATPTPEATPTTSPTPEPTPTPTSTPTPSPTQTPLPEPTPTPTPAMSPGPTTTPLPSPSPKDGTVTLTPEIRGDGFAVATVDETTLEAALQTAPTGPGNKKIITLKVEKLPDAKGYIQQIPAGFLSDSGNANVRVAMETEVATVIVPGNMFTREQAGSASNVGISVAPVDRGSLPESARNRVGDKPVIEINVFLDGQKVAWNNENAPVTISIPYTPTAEELADPEHIVVWYIDGLGNAVPVPSGKYDPATGTVTFTTTHLSTYAVAFVKKTFSDIAASWAKKEIEVLASKGIIAGYAGKYNPKDQITRADFLKLLVTTLGLTAEVDSNFDDVKPGEYFYEYVGIAKKLGIARGDGKNRFNPRAPILRQDMMVLVERALRVAGKLQGDAGLSVLSGFTDVNDISDYAKQSIANLVAEGIVKGSNNRINPGGYFTREEAAAIMYRIYYK